MRAAAIFAGLFLFLGLSAAQADPCQLVRYSQIPMTDNPFHQILIPVVVNGTKSTFVLDTGSPLTGLASSTADAQSLPRIFVSHGLYTVTGAYSPYFVKVADLWIDKIEVKDAYLFVVPVVRADSTGGLLGANMLELMDLDFDFAGHVLNLFAPSQCGAGVVYWSPRTGAVPFTIRGGHIAIEVELDGKFIHAIVDTGSTTTILGGLVARRRFDLRPGGAGTQKIDGAGPHSLVQYTHRFDLLSFGDVTVKEPVIGLTSGGIEDGLIIGMDVLSKLHVYLSYKQRMLYVTPADVGHPAAPTAMASSAQWNGNN